MKMVAVMNPAGRVMSNNFFNRDRPPSALSLGHVLDLSQLCTPLIIALSNVNRLF
jgi:hypothetical protein